MPDYPARRIDSTDRGMRTLELVGPPTTSAERPPALLALGFRPFYLLAAAWSALVVPLWVLQLAGVLQAPHLGMAWHAHEMVFGVAAAVVAGFLLTAVQTWTGHRTPAGWPLAALGLVWVLARVLAFTAWGLPTAAVNVAFPVLIAAVIAVPIARARNTRNVMFVLVLLALGVAALLTHWSFLRPADRPAVAGVPFAVDLVLVLITVVLGRVAPMFTNNGVPGANAKRYPWLERVVLGATLAVLVVDRVLPASRWSLAILLLAAVAHAIRLSCWKPWRTLRTPLVWILHASSLWIVLHLLLRAAAAEGLLAAPLALHALTVGGIGGAMIGMMCRTARGHTGRPIRADRWDTSMFVLLQVAALARLGGIATTGNGYLATLFVAAVCWSLAFALYAGCYARALATPRIDGKPG